MTCWEPPDCLSVLCNNTTTRCLRQQHSQQMVEFIVNGCLLEKHSKVFIRKQFHLYTHTCCQWPFFCLLELWFMFTRSDWLSVCVCKCWNTSGLQWEAPLSGPVNTPACGECHSWEQVVVYTPEATMPALCLPPGVCTHRHSHILAHTHIHSNQDLLRKQINKLYSPTEQQHTQSYALGHMQAPTYLQCLRSVTTYNFTIKVMCRINCSHHSVKKKLQDCLCERVTIKAEWESWNRLRQKARIERNQRASFSLLALRSPEIGRASCRERV